MKSLRQWMVVSFLSLLPVAFGAVTAAAQFDGGFAPKFPAADAAPGGKQVTLSATYEVAEGSNVGRLHIKADLQPTWHVYSVTQAEGGPLPTKITSAGPAGVQLAGPPVPDEEPRRSVSSIYKDVTIEEHEKSVVWTIPVLWNDGARPAAVAPQVKIEGLVCKTDGSCVPFDEQLTAKFSGVYAPAAEVFREADSVVQWQAQLQPPVVAAGQTAKLTLTATPDEGYHVYGAATDDAAFSTNFVITRKGVLRAAAPVPSKPPVSKEMVPGTPPVSVQEGPVSWTIELKVPEAAVQGGYPVAGMVAYQACTDTSCRQPLALRFATVLEVGPLGDATSKPVSLEAAKYADAMDAAAGGRWVDADDDREAAGPVIIHGQQQAQYPLALILVMGFAAGMILNLMPCVLPVLGLKVMAFVDSAGQDRGRVFATNAWYSLGILSVFWAIAAAVILFSFSWGEQFTIFGFRLALTILVFAFALSFLGVWEIPVPGFASGKTSQQLQHQEGALGSFSKGVFTTILATPCSGPLLGGVLGLMLGKPAPVVLSVFTAMGAGMAAPYMAVAISPRLVGWLPKPGAWMETLKQIMGFVLLGTVAYFFSTFADHQKVPLFIALIGVWFGCWIIGRVPQWEALGKRAAAWGGGIAVAALVTFIAFRPTAAPELAWVPYDEARLQQLQRSGKTVLVDFTAKWCVNCQVNYHLAIDTDPTADLVRQLDAVPMLADWTDRNPEIKQKLNQLNSNAIPVLAIYPGSRPAEPIVLRDLVTQQQVLDALSQAGPSVDRAELALASDGDALQR